MDKDLQKKILAIIEENNGVAEWNHIIANVLIGTPVKDLKKMKAIVKHQLDLMEKQDMVIRKDQLPNIYYTLAPRGHMILESWPKRMSNFILYDKHNLFIILAFVVSVVSLIISIWH